MERHFTPKRGFGRMRLPMKGANVDEAQYFFMADASMLLEDRQ